MSEKERREGMEEMRKQIADIHKVLLGNGDPKKGLVYKVAVVETHVSFMNRFGWLILTSAVGLPFALVYYKLTHS